MYQVINRVDAEKFETENEFSVWAYMNNIKDTTPFSKIHKIGKDVWEIVQTKPTERQKQLIEKFSWCGRDWVEKQIWAGYKTEKAIWYRIHQMPEWYFG